VLALLALAACAGAGSGGPGVSSLRGAPDPVAAAALAEGAPPAGRARLLVVAGTWDNTGNPKVVLARESSVRGDIVIDGARVAFFENRQGLVFDLPSGSHTLHWDLRDWFTDSAGDLPWVTAIPITVQLRPGRTTAFTADVIDRANVRQYFSILDWALGVHPPIDLRLEGRIYSVLTPVEDVQSLLTRRATILSPQTGRLAEVPGASLTGR
jgi:hypothetical protein